MKSFTNRLDDGSRRLGQRGRPKGWIRSPVKNSEYSVFASQSVTRFFSFSMELSAAPILVLINPYRRRLPHEAGRTAVLGTNF